MDTQQYIAHLDRMLYFLNLSPLDEKAAKFSFLTFLPQWVESADDTKPLCPIAAWLRTLRRKCFGTTSTDLQNARTATTQENYNR